MQYDDDAVDTLLRMNQEDGDLGGMEDIDLGTGQDIDMGIENLNEIFKSGDRQDEGRHDEGGALADLAREGD